VSHFRQSATTVTRTREGSRPRGVGVVLAPSGLAAAGVRLRAAAGVALSDDEQGDRMVTIESPCELFVHKLGVALKIENKIHDMLFRTFTLTPLKAFSGCSRRASGASITRSARCTCRATWTSTRCATTLRRCSGRFWIASRRIV
jgi:hypothetical protein